MSDAEFLQALRKSLGSQQNADGRWVERSKTGLSDDELRAAIAHVYGLGGGYSSPSGLMYGYRGGADPVFVFGAMDPLPRWRVPGARYVRGDELLRLARHVLAIGQPLPEGQFVLPGLEVRRNAELR